MKLNFVSVKLNFVSVKLNFVSVKLNFVSVKLNFVSVKLVFVCVKLNFVCVKLNFVCVKLNFVCEKSTWKWYSGVGGLCGTFWELREGNFVHWDVVQGIFVIGGFCHWEFSPWGILLSEILSPLSILLDNVL